MIRLKGKCISKFIYSHNSHNEDYFYTYLQIERLSGATDTVLLIIPHRLINPSSDFTDTFIDVKGEVRTHNYREGDKRHKQVYVYVSSLDVCVPEYKNELNIKGVVCSTPNNRYTLRNKPICDFTLVNNIGKPNYIPCILFKHCDFSVGDNIRIIGHLQSKDVKGRLVHEVVADKYI